MDFDRFTATEVCGIFRSADPKGRSITISSRRSACFIITISGKIRFTFAGGVYETTPEKALYIQENASYKNECIETADSLVFNFKADLSKPIPLTAPPKSSSLSAFYNMSRAFPGNCISDRSILLSEIYLLASFLFSEIDGEKTAEVIVRNAVKYMYDVYSRPEIKIKDIADYVHVSEIYIYKLFKAKYNETPFHYLTKIRMEQASFLLQNGFSINQTAENVGYASIYSFSRAYKQFYGVSPSAARNNA